MRLTVPVANKERRSVHNSVHIKSMLDNYLNNISRRTGGLSVTGSDSKRKFIKMHAWRKTPPKKKKRKTTLTQ